MWHKRVHRIVCAHPYLRSIFYWYVFYRQEGAGGDISELDDCEEDDHFDPNEEYDPEVWKGYTEEEFKEYKELGARLEREEVKLQNRIQ